MEFREVYNSLLAGENFSAFSKRLQSLQLHCRSFMFWPVLQHPRMEENTRRRVHWEFRRSVIPRFRPQATSFQYLLRHFRPAIRPYGI